MSSLRPELQALRRAVQTNCHIADARHASDYTLCVYLLKMREYYRWEQRYPLGDPLSNQSVGDWLVEREALWEELEDQAYGPLSLDGTSVAPFETDRINAQLFDQGLVYSAGLGHKGRPHFFLGDLERRERLDDYHILVSGREYARDLSAPPAMALGDTIFVRRESFRRLIWEKLEEWRWHKLDNPMGRAIAHYDFDADIDAALDAMTENEVEAVVLHEVGEVMAGRQLGHGWQDMIAHMSRSRAEIMARAVRDHLADALSTLPNLLERNSDASLHFYMANISGMRKQIFPSLQQAYEQWRSTQELRPLRRLVETSRKHWLEVAERMLSLHKAHGQACQPRLEALIDNSHL